MIEKGKVKKAEVEKKPAAKKEEGKAIPVETKEIPKEKKRDESKIQVDNKIEFHKFWIDNLTVKTVNEKGQRLIRLGIIKGMENVAMDYDVVMLFDPEPFDSAIRAVEKERTQYESQNQTEMFGQERERKIESFLLRIKKITHEKTEQLKKCPEIKFAAKRKLVNESSINTKIDLIVSQEVINKLNDAWEEVQHYKIQFQEV